MFPFPPKLRRVHARDWRQGYPNRIHSAQCSFLPLSLPLSRPLCLSVCLNLAPHQRVRVRDYGILRPISVYAYRSRDRVPSYRATRFHKWACRVPDNTKRNIRPVAIDHAGCARGCTLRPCAAEPRVPVYLL